MFYREERSSHHSFHPQETILPHLDLLMSWEQIPISVDWLPRLSWVQLFLFIKFDSIKNTSHWIVYCIASIKNLIESYDNWFSDKITNKFIEYQSKRLLYAKGFIISWYFKVNIVKNYWFHEQIILNNLLKYFYFKWKTLIIYDTEVSIQSTIFEFFSRNWL